MSVSTANGHMFCNFRGAVLAARPWSSGYMDVGPGGATYFRLIYYSTDKNHRHRILWSLDGVAAHTTEVGNWTLANIAGDVVHNVKCRFVKIELEVGGDSADSLLQAFFW